jgi:hypothetical protein
MEPRRVDFVVLTHAHLDHSGLLPKLCAAGFTGPIYATPATRELVGVLLPDSAHLQKVEAERAARHGRDFTAVYGIEEVATALGQLNAVPYDQILARLPPASSDCGDRSGLRRVFIGSTAESVLDRLTCDLAPAYEHAESTAYGSWPERRQSS